LINYLKRKVLMRKPIVVGLLIFLLPVLGFSQFVSSQSGAWTVGTTWGGGCAIGCVAGTDYPGANDVATISAGHNVIIPAGVSISRTAQTNVSGSIEMEDDGLGGNGFLSVGGLLILNQGGSFVNDGTTTIEFTSSSTYRHNYTTSAGNIIVASWLNGSTCEIFGYTSNSTAPGNLGQDFHHFTWNCASFIGGGGPSTFISLNGALTTVFGDLTIANTGGSTRTLRFFDVSLGNTLTVAGDISITGSARVVFSTSGTGNIVNATNFSMSNTIASVNTLATSGSTSLILTGNFPLDATATSSFNMASLGTGSGTINVGGNFTINSGNTLTRAGSPTGTASVVFTTGVATKTFTNSGTISNAINFTNNSGSTLGLGTSAIAGSGTFSNSGTIEVGLADPFSVSLGNIRNSGTKIFGAGSTVVFNGSSLQDISSNFPSASINLTLSNTAGVQLTNDLTIQSTRRLNIASSSVLSLNGFTLNMNGVLAGTGPISGGSNSGLIIGGTGNLDDAGTPGANNLTFGSPFQIDNLTINRSSGIVTLGSNVTLLESGIFTQSAGDFVLNGNTLTISGEYARTGGNITPSATSSLTIDGSGNLPASFSFNGTLALANLVMERAGGTLTTAASLSVSNLFLNNGVFNNTGSITMASGGTITRTDLGSMSSAPAATSTYHVIYNADDPMSTGVELPTGTELNNLTKNGSGALTLSAPVIVTGTLSLLNGSFNAGSNAIELRGNFNSAAASVLTSSTVTIANSTTITGTPSASPPTFGALVVNGTLTPNINYRVNGAITNNGTIAAGTGSVSFGGTTTISGGTNSFNGVTILGSSSLTAPATMNVAGSFTNNGTFNHNSGTVNFNGTSSIIGTSPQFFTVTVTGTLSAPTNLNIGSNLNVNGTFTHNSGTVVFNGTGAQQLNRTTGAGAVNIDLFNVNVNKATGTFFIESTVTGAVFRVENEFLISQNSAAGTDIDFDGTPTNGEGAGRLLLRSTAARTARIPLVPNGTTTVGRLTVERFIDNNATLRAYRYFTPAVVGATVDDWQAEIQITGAFSNPSSGAGITNPNSPSMYRYLETNGGNSTNRYQAYPNNIALPASSFALTNATGYAIFVRSTGTPTLNTRGTLRSGDVPISITVTGSEPDAAGYHLLGNPYPSPIDWDLVTLPGGISSTISLKDNVDATGVLDPGQFVYYMQGGPNIGGFTGVLASGQGFWVQATSAATLTFSEAHKVGDTDPTLVRQKQLADVLRIKIHGAGKRDETVIWLNEEATENFDLRFDALKKNNDYVNLYTYFATEPLSKMAINGVADFGCAKTFNIGLSDLDVNEVNIVPAGTYTLEFSDFETFTTEHSYTLVDKFTNSTVDVKANREYVFEVTANPSSFGDNRFELMIDQLPVELNKVITYSDVCLNESAQLTIEGSEPGVAYEVRSATGSILSEKVIGNGSNISITLSSDALQTGQNEINVYASRSTCAALPMEQAVAIVVHPIYEIEPMENLVGCSGDSFEIQASGVPAEGTYRWYETESSSDIIAEGDHLNTGALNTSKTYFVSSVNALGCESGRTSVSVDIVTFDTPAITDNVSRCQPGSVVLSASGAPEGGSYKWYANEVTTDVLYEGSSYETPVLDRNKDFFVSMTNAQGCEGPRTQVDVTVAVYEEAVIEMLDGGVLKSNFTQGNQWLVNGVPIEGATHQEFQPDASGTYQLQVQIGECTSTTEIVYTVTDAEGDIASGIEIFPNPVDKVMTIKLQRSEPAVAGIYDLAGTKIGDVSFTLVNSQWVGQYEFLNAASGFYLLKVRQGTTTRNLKLIKK
jgi:hypothetical protein